LVSLANLLPFKSKELEPSQLNLLQDIRVIFVLSSKSIVSSSFSKQVPIPTDWTIIPVYEKTPFLL